MNAHSSLFRLPHRADLEGRLVARYDRFIAVVRLEDGREVRAHCVNPGKMEGVVRPGARVWLREAPPERKRKLRFTWELLEVPTPSGAELLGVDTTAPNRIVEGLLAAKVLPGMRRYRQLYTEAPSGAHRVDFLLEGARPHWVEVKNVHLLYPDGRAYFPDSRSVRSAEHVRHLARLAEDARTTVLFVVQWSGAVRAVRPSALHDPELFEACREARDAGVRFRGLRVRPTLDAYEVVEELPVELRRYDPTRLEAWRAANAETSGWRRDPARVKSGRGGE